MNWFKINHRLGVIFIFIFLIVRGCYILFPVEENIPCRREEEVRLKEYNGYVLNSFRDTQNHGSLTIEFSDPLKKNIFFDNDKSGVFFYIQKGDLITKVKGKLGITVKRGKESKYFQLDYGCNENKLSSSHSAHPLKSREL